MTQTERAQALARALSLLTRAYSVPAWAPEVLDTYQAVLADLDPGAVQAAVLAWIKTKSDRPSIAQLRDAVRKQLEAAATIPTDLEPDEAWGYVVECFRDVGYYRAFPAHPHPLVAEAVSRLGWQTMCLSENQVADRAHFLRLYDDILCRERERRLQAPALRREGDQARLAARGSAALVPRVPKTGMVRIGEATPTVLGTVPREVMPVPTPTEPTEADRQRAKERKALLRRQLKDLKPEGEA